MQGFLAPSNKVLNVEICTTRRLNEVTDAIRAQLGPVYKADAAPHKQHGHYVSSLVVQTAEGDQVFSRWTPGDKGPREGAARHRSPAVNLRFSHSTALRVALFCLKQVFHCMHAKILLHLICT